MEWIKAKHYEAQLKCGCGCKRFFVFETEDGDIYVRCAECSEETGVR